MYITTLLTNVTPCGSHLLKYVLIGNKIKCFNFHLSYLGSPMYSNNKVQACVVTVKYFLKKAVTFQKNVSHGDAVQGECRLITSLS